MAEGTFILRPCKDISIGHQFRPTDSTNGYLLVNEENADDSATYLHAAESSSKSDFFSKFVLSGSAPNEKIKVTNINIIFRYSCELEKDGCHASIYVCLTSDGVSEKTSTLYLGSTDDEEGNEKYVTETITDFDGSDTLKKTINSYISEHGTLPEIELELCTMVEGFENGTTGSYDAVVNITQVYVEISYTTKININIHKKVNASYKATTDAYQKIDGTWSELSEDECKTILRNNTIRPG